MFLTIRAHTEYGMNAANIYASDVVNHIITPKIGFMFIYS